MKYDWQGLPAAERTDAIWKQGPPEFPIGCRSSTDFVLSDLSLVLWFATTAELVTWFMEGDPELEELEFDRRAAMTVKLGEIHRRVSTDDLALADLTVALREAFAGWISIDWLGTFDELCHDSTPEAEEARSVFREQELTSEDELSGDGLRASISERELDAFAEFLSGDQWRGV